MIRIDRTGERTWRAWLGTGDASSLTQLDVAEFASASAARSWVEQRLLATGTRLGAPVYGSVDSGRYVGARWEPAAVPGLDADLVDGRIRWRRPGA
ncbi:MAG TPA: hypothetical protein VHH15_12405 [Actinophytocola sp.]|nr:hypothetical protein [Actinophytocola sp.]